MWVPRLRVANAKGKPLVTSVLVPYNPQRLTNRTSTNNYTYTMLHWNVHLEGTFNFDLDNAIFPLDQQELALTLVNPYPSSTYFHYMQPEAANPCRSHKHRAAAYNYRLLPRVNVAGRL